MKKRNWGKRIAIMIGIGVIAIFVFSSIVMLLWNNVLTSVLHLSAISFWQALGILVLSKILFSGFGRGGGYRGHFWRRGMMQRKWESMTPEEREQFKENLRNRCGGWGSGPWQAKAEAEAAKPQA
jgi:Ca2+/H+ antiporter, TMEM165/GDT1 family